MPLDTAGTPSLWFLDSLYIDEPILALDKFEHPNLPTDCLLLLTETYQLLFLWFDPTLSRFSILSTITFDASNQQLPSDALPKIIIDPSPNPEFFLVYFFEGFLQVFIINNSWSPSDGSANRPKRKHDQHEIVEEFTSSIGGIVFQDIKIHQNTGSSKVFSVLYRDYNYAYSLRSYSLDINNKSISILRQFDEFNEAPTTLINPTNGGLLILTDSYIFYFPNPEITLLELSDNNADANISCNSEECVITKRLTISGSTDISAFSYFTIIDERRILLVNNRGETYLLFFDSVKKSKSLFQVNSISFVKLGPTTVPINVLHITDNVFFVASKLSQSVLFKILTKEPYIDICQFVSSSPPVLDIQVQNNGNQIELFTCQGGYESGEYRRISNRLSYLDFKKSFQCESKHSDISEFFRSDDEAIIRVYDPEIQKAQYFSLNSNYCYQHLETKNTETILTKKDASGLLEVSQEEISLNGTVINKMGVSKVKAVNSTSFVVLDNENTFHVYSEVLIQSVKLKKSTEVSAMDVVNVFEREYLILICFWDGSYELYSVSDSEFELVREEKPSRNGVPISSCCLVYDYHQKPGSTWILLITSNNDLIQEFLDFRKNEIESSRSRIIHLDGIPFKFTKNQLNEVIIFNKKKIFGLYNDKTTNFNRIFVLDTLNPRLDINDITFIGNKHLAISSNTDEVFIYSVESFDSTKDVIFSNSFNIKSVKIPRFKQALLLSSKNAFINEINDYRRNSYLQLVDLGQMKVISKVEFPETKPVELVDICIVPTIGLDSQSSGPGVYAIGLCNSTSPSEIIRIFQIKKGKLNELPMIKILGLSDISKYTFQNIQLIDKNNNYYLVSGVINFIIKPRSLHEWVVLPDCVHASPVFSVAASYFDRTLIFGDVVKGITTVNLKVDEQESIALDKDTTRTFLETTFVTDVVSFVSEDGEIIFITDSTGNFTGITLSSELENEGIEDNSDIKDFKEIISYNLGDSINLATLIPEAHHERDFHSNFDKIEQETSIVRGKVLMGTVNGGIYTLSELIDTDEEIQDIITECSKELILFKHTLSDIQYTSKRDKYNMWLSKREKRLLQQDSSGQLSKKPNKGVLDLIFIQYWLNRDAVLRQHDLIDESAQELEEMKNSLRSCYKHQSLLQRIVFDVQGV
ncbi:hypothetical protein PSN45_003314 [Yamadazyma tenuis]|uniref:uncharacterized protein n=1 Tax=Candida tenuis TaxID=2315449 RepID=UPI00279F932B|nr:hypothetical protein PSN45_003314 [Yamadazyma tenuis]